MKRYGPTGRASAQASKYVLAFRFLAMTERRLSFGSWLRRRRNALDLTQAELATRSGCVLTTIKKIETGARQPSRLLSREVGENGHSAQPLPSVRITFHHGLVSNVAASPALSPPSCGRNQ